MEKNYSIKIKTKIVFGEDSILNIVDEVNFFGVRKIMLVADKGVRKTGIVDKISDLLEEASYAVLHFEEIVANPQSYDCEHGAQLAIENKIELIIAVGGGSSMDTAKAIAGMAGHGTTNFEDITYPKTYTCKPLPLICIPTTAGTGSEVTTCGVITDSKTHKKVYCFDPECAPEVAIADPALLMSLPKELAAATAVDALTHGIESYVAKCSNHITAAMGLYGIRIIARNIRDYVYNRNQENASEMMMGSLLNGIAFGYSDTGCVHTLSETISKYYEISHGLGNAIFLVPVTEFSIPYDEFHYAEITEAMGEADAGNSVFENAKKLTQILRQLISDLEIPNFKEVKGVNPNDFEAIAEDCLEHISTSSNPRLMKKEDFISILEKTYTDME